MSANRYTSIDDLPQRLPVFPLRGAILLPRAVLPLNIFEPRYVQMFDAALSGDRLVVIVQPAGSGEDESPMGDNPPLRRVGCVGRITAFQELDDGRMIVTLSGIARCEMLGEVPSGALYRTFKVRYTPYTHDLVPGRDEQSVDREALLNTLKLYLEARDLKADWAAIARAGTEPLVNALALMSPYGTEEKQALLEAKDTKTRADILVALAEMELASTGTSGGSTLQ
jgi:uncharacterized protein